MKMSKRKEWEYSKPAVMTTAVRRRTKLGILTTTVGGVGDKEGRRGSKRAELNWNHTPDQVQA